MSMKKSFLLLCLGFSVFPVWGLVSLDSYILGDFSEEYEEYRTDPLNYIYRLDQKITKQLEDDKNREYRDLLDQFIGFTLEGENLQNFCSSGPRIRYSSDWQREQALRAMYGTLQYITLDLAVRAIGAYARSFEIEKEDYQLFADNLVQNNCSPNISVISKKELLNNLKVQYSRGSYVLPTLEKNPFFPHLLHDSSKLREWREKEFNYTVKLFRSACSWGGRVEAPRLLAPLLRDPFVMAFVTRQMTKTRISRDYTTKKLKLAYDPQTVQVACENFICRRVSENKFDQDTPRSLGTSGYGDDFKRLYCGFTSKADRYPQENQSKIKKWIKDQTLVDQRLIVSQFVSLVSQIPDWFVRSEKFVDVKSIARGSVEQTWNDWAENSIANLNQELSFEENLVVEAIGPEKFFDPKKENFRVEFDVSLGEFDRSIMSKGKISSHFNIKVHKNLLAQIRREWIRLDPTQNKRKQDLKRLLERHIEEGMKSAEKVQVFRKVKGNLNSLVVNQILRMLELYEGRYFEKRENVFVNIPVRFNYGLFALRYIHQKKLGDEELN